MFNIANLLVVAAVDVAGLAVAFPVAIGLTLVIGARPRPTPSTSPRATSACTGWGSWGASNRLITAMFVLFIAGLATIIAARLA